jgi:hypothetical protein
LKPQVFSNAIATLITPVTKFKEGHKPTMEEQAQLVHFNTTREMNCGLIYRLWEVNLDQIAGAEGTVCQALGEVVSRCGEVRRYRHVDEAAIR